MDILVFLRRLNFHKSLSFWDKLDGVRSSHALSAILSNVFELILKLALKMELEMVFRGCLRRNNDAFSLIRETGLLHSLKT